ncbi:hypothetical protein ACTXMB_14415 [Arthrobacter rhombi]|uniref:hypothetical protein n=1 Tax=Arthrobacter rhombi TaxID=71253 RepID=UPI003FD52FAF
MEVIDLVVSGATVAGALLTATGLVYAHFQIKESRRQSREEGVRRQQEKEQKRYNYALSIGVKALWNQTGSDHTGTRPLKTTCTVTVSNGSPFAITNVRLDVERDEPSPIEQVWGTVLPGALENEVFEMKRAPLPFSALTGGVVLNFSDAFGNHWRRTPEGLKEMENPALTC